MAKFNILIVDDIFVNRMLLTEIADGINANYSEARNGKEAIELLEIEDFDVVLMDIEMPVMNGFETTEYIRNKFPEPKKSIPIIAVTAHYVSKYKDKFAETGFTCVLTKPYTVERLENILKELFPKHFNFLT